MSHGHNGIRRRQVLITDLDHSDSHQQRRPTTIEAGGRTTTEATADGGQRRAHRHKRNLRTISGNFNCRSGSAECLELHDDQMVVESGGDRHAKPIKVSSHINDLLQTKEKQMEKLLERLGLLHKFNEQFAEENRKLRDDIETLEAGAAELRKQIVDCRQCRQLGERLEQVEEANKSLDLDIEMMKTLVYRLNVQIEHHQDQLRQCNGYNASDVPSITRQKSSISPWLQGEAVRVHTLGPLLRSYDEILSDKEQLIQQYQQDFDHFTGELKRVTEENNRLLQQNDQLKRDFGTWREERTRLRAQSTVSHQKAEAQARKSDLAKEKLVEVMHCYEQKTQTLTLELEHLQSAYTRCKTDLAHLKAQSAPEAPSTLAHSLAECKELLEQLRQQHSREKQKLERTIAELSERNGDEKAKVEKLRHENGSLKTALEKQDVDFEEHRRRAAAQQRDLERMTRSRDRIKARLRIALQWTQKLEDGQEGVQETWESLKRLETIVKHKESQVRGLQSRHVQEIDKMQKRLNQKEETIRTILRGQLAIGSRSNAGATAKGMDGDGGGGGGGGGKGEAVKKC